MAAEVDKKDEHAGAPPKKGKGLLIGIIAAVVIALGAGGYLFLVKGKSDGVAGQGESAPSGGGHGAPEAKTASNIFNLDPFIVNLLDNSGTRYLKLTINLELSPGASTSELTSLSTQIRDSLIILLSSKSYSDIGTVEGKYQMRDEIVTRVNQYLTKGQVKTAYFTEFVIQ